MNVANANESVTAAGLIECLELWHVEPDGASLRRHHQLRLHDGCLTGPDDDVRIREGEGPAGMAWHQKRAVILHEEPSALLHRIGVQQGLELAALVAFPVIRGQDVLSVVVLGIGNGPGAFEVWRRDDRDELSVSAGYYSHLRTFEYISRHVRFPKGAGLPGAVWKTGLPRLTRDLPTSDRFMRSFASDEAELNTGLGLPVGSSAGLSDSVLLLLSSNERPIARSFEILPPGESQRAGISPSSSTSSSTPESRTRRAYALPLAESQLPEVPPELVRPALEPIGDGQFALTIPVYRNRELAATVELQF